MHDIIEKWKLNKNLLASKMGMPKGTFNNKLNPKHSSDFTEDELFKLKGILQELYDDLAPFIEVDFNEALKKIVKGGKNEI